MRISILALFTLFLMSFGCSEDINWEEPQVIEEQFKENLRGVYNVRYVQKPDTTQKEGIEGVFSSLEKGIMSLFRFNVTFQNGGKGVFIAMGKETMIDWEMKGEKLSIYALDSAGTRIEDKDNFFKNAFVRGFDGNYNKFMLAASDTSKLSQGWLFEKIGEPLKTK